MPPFSELFGDADRNRRVIVPGLAEYYTTPSRENARALLLSLGLPVPYAALVQFAAAAASRRKTPPAPASEHSDLFTLESDSSSSGGGRSRRAKPRAGPSVPAPPIPYVAPFKMIEPPALFEAHRLLDLLHDLLPMQISDALQERIYEKARVSPELVAELTPFVAESYNKPSSVSRINHRLTDIAEALAGLSSPRSHALAFKPDHTLIASEMDRYLHAAVSRWYAKPSLEIVLDGIFRVKTLPRADRIGAELNEAMNDTEVARSLTLCAYLQLAMTDWDTVHPEISIITPRVQSKQIMFLIGDFQTLDVAGANRFIRDWISHIKTETAYLSHLPPSAIGTRRISIAEIPSLADTPFANIAVNSSGLRVKLPERANVASGAMRSAIRKGIFVPYGSKRKLSREELGNSVSRLLPVKPLPSIADRYQSGFFTSNTKEWMHEVFRRYRDDNDQAPETEAFIETLAFVNAFRDAIRAEVALARGAVYITIDAMSLVYYQARADRTDTATGAGKHSDGLMIHPNGIANLAISYYTPKRIGSQSRSAARAAAPAPAGI